MKRRFATKLILSGAALAVSAATLVSTTYAWYVQNSQVTATGVSGTVQDKDASSIFISKDYALADKSATWLPGVEYVEADYIRAIANNGKYVKPATGNDVNPEEGKMYDGGLEPVTRKSSDGSYVYVNNVATKGGKYSDDSVYAEVKASGRKIEFNLYVQTNTANTIVRPYIIIKNTTTKDTMKTQTAYRAISAASVIAKDSVVWTDAVQALRMEVDVYEATAGTPNTWTNVTTNTSKGYYDVLSIAKKDNPSVGTYNPYEVVSSITGADAAIKYVVESTLSDEYIEAAAYSAGVDYYSFDSSVYTKLASQPTDQASFATAKAAAPNQKLYILLKGANAYYYGMTNSVPAATFTDQLSYVDTSSTGKIAATKLVDANTAYKFKFVLWLEGTDAACFDSCASQTFDIKVNFDVEATA